MIAAVTNAHAATSTTTALKVGLTTAPTTAITAASYGASVTLTATITPSTAVGTVTFSDGQSALGSPVTVTSGTASLATTALALGTNSLTAVFTPTNSANFTTSTSSASTVTVSAATTTTTLKVALTSAPSTAITAASFGASVTLTATVTPSTTAGTVTFKDGTSTLGSPVALSSGTAALATTSLTLGSNSLTAVFTPTNSSDYNSSTSTASTVTVSKANTTTTLSAALASVPSTPVTSVPSGSSVILTAAVSPSTAAGTVSFSNGNTVLGSATVNSGVASLTTSALTTLGSNSLTASYTPSQSVSADYNSSTGPLSLTVTKPAATVALSLTPASGPYYYDNTLTLTATLTPSTATGIVNFNNGSTALGSCTVASGGTCNTVLSRTSLTLGTYSVTAAYAGNSSYSGSTSSPQSISVVSTPTQVALASSQTSIRPGTSLTLTATVTPAAGSATISSGSVTFYDVSTSISVQLGKATVSSSGIATLSGVTTLTTPGSHFLTASYGGVYSSGSALFGTSLSPTTKVSVNSSQTITFTQPAATATYGTNATLSATSTSGLTVTFSTSSTPSTCSVSGTTLSFIGVGTCTVSAQQAGNSSWTAATPVSYNVTVNPAAPTISHWFNQSAVYGTPVTLSATSNSSGAISYAVVSGPGSISGTTLTPTGVGTITVGVTEAANGNYAAITTPVTKTVTVYQAPLNITASSPTVTYGAAVPTITASYAGLVNGDSATTTAPTCRTSYTSVSTSHPGTYSAYCYGAVDARYSITYTSGTVTVTRATPTMFTAPIFATITYGQALSAATLSTSGTAHAAVFASTTTVAGTWTWTSPSTIPHVGAAQNVTFTPSDSQDYATVTSFSVTPTVNQYTPSITVNPFASSVPYNSVLSASKLSGGTVVGANSATITGTFAWNSPSTSLTNVGSSNPESVTFTPTDSTDYATPSSVTVNVTVVKATPTIVWPTASAIAYGQALSASSLTGGSATVGGNPITGSGGGFAWTTPSAIPTVGSPTESVTYTPPTADQGIYATVTGTVRVTVSKVTVTINNLPTASAITYGQTLNHSRLTGGSAIIPNTSTVVPGTFSWSGTPSSITPTVGASESVTFTPSNATLYNTATANVSVTVNQASPTVTQWPTASAINLGQTLASSTLAGGSANDVNGNAINGGSFAFTTPSTASNSGLVAGTTLYSVTYTPADTTDYADVTGSVYVTVNPCGYQDSANSAYSAAMYLSIDGYNGYLAAPSSIDVEGSNLSAVCAVNSSPTDTNANITVTYPFITSNSSSSYPADSSAYGLNAAVLAYGTETTPGSGATITIADDGSGDPGYISTSGDSSGGVFASMGGTVNISDTIVNTQGNNAHGLEATYGGTLTISNVQASTNGNNSSTVLTGVGGGTVTITGGTYSANAPSSPTSAIRAAGTGSTITLDDTGTGGTTVSATNGTAVAIEGANSVSVNSVVNTSLSGQGGNNHGIYLYYGNSGDATAGTGSFSMTGGSISYSCDPNEISSCGSGLASSGQNYPATLFSIANTTANITLTDVNVTNDTPTSSYSNATLLTAAALNSGTAGQNGGNVTFTANGETLTGDVIVDQHSTARIFLNADSSANPSSLTGAINNANSGAVTVSLTLDATSQWVVTGDSYLTSLTNPVAGNANITCAGGAPSCNVFVGGQRITIGN